MWYLEEAIKQLNESEEENKNRIFVDKNTGKKYQKINGKFVEILSKKSKSGGDIGPIVDFPQDEDDQENDSDEKD